MGDGADVVAAARGAKADVVLMDIQMPGVDGLQATALVREALPDVKVLILTTFDRPGYLRRAIEAGASGFLVKDMDASKLADAVRRVATGMRVVDPDLAAESLFTGHNPLTDREREVLRPSLYGSPVAVIANEVCLATGTVRNLLSSAIGKLNATSRVEAAQRAQSYGWL